MVVVSSSADQTRPLLHTAVSPSSPFGPDAPLLLAYRSSKAFILVTICLALFTDSFIYGVLVPVLPFMLSSRCHVEEGTEQLWTSALFAVFGIAILVGSPICGHFADRTQSRRTPLLLGLPVLAAATVLIGVGESVWILLASRLLAGFSTAVTWTVGLALTRDTVGERDVGQWMGTALSSSSIGLIISPLLGGIVYASADVWGVLGMMAGLVLLNALFVCFMVEQRVAQRYLLADTDDNAAAGHHSRGIPSQDAGRTHPGFPTQNASYGTLDAAGKKQAVTSCWKCVSAHASDSEHGEGASGSTCSLHNDRTGEDQHDWDQASVLPEAEVAPRMAPMLRLLRSPRVLTGAYGVFTQFGILASFDAFLPLFVERRFGWGSLGSGLIFLNIALPALFGPFAGKISDRYGPRRVALAGCILTAPPLFLIRLVGYDSKEQIVFLCGLLVLVGFFLTLIISPLAADLSFAVDQMEEAEPGVFGDKGAYAQAYALFNCAMAAATVVGPILAGSLQDSYGAPASALMMSIWCISAAVPVLFFIGDGANTPRASDIEQPVIHRIIISRPVSFMQPQ